MLPMLSPEAADEGFGLAEHSPGQAHFVLMTAVWKENQKILLLGRSRLAEILYLVGKNRQQRTEE